ncbi:hypothetical protein B0T25DRAFT_195310 [Lasiosphaeria hispida]|uniref:D-isomer specific 2-hydroxyacid dehydrogenase NAD-binding domain-containing protein n=1 Tax=Lasiosphaeria hispida TaxID=260671 RepID=A0AAJ0ME67_9PEZI|nr:hypothetical protein B0T25DRAFT_195310 [Lasiosphaeria hispida]
MLIKQVTTGPPNKTLKGHKLAVIMPLISEPGFFDDLKSEFPDLEIVVHKLAWGQSAAPFPESEWADVTIILTFNTLPKPEEAPKLQYVQLLSAGANHILDNPLFKDTDITFCTANGVHGPQISEWIISTYLAFEHHIPDFLDRQKEARWDRGESLSNIEDAVSKTVGILGYGSIGRQTARVATAIGMKVHAYTLHPRPTPESRRDDSWTPAGLGDPNGIFPTKWFSGGSKEDLHKFLGSGLDLLVVATPLTNNTQHLLAAPEFKVLADAKPGRTFLSNIARGPVVETDDLIEALETGLIRGAALDVTDPEPLPDGHKLWTAKNVIVTPHVSGASTSYSKRVLAILEYNLKRLSEGQELTNKINRKEGY